MNIFAVDDNPLRAAQALHDSHIVKMATEAAQILSTVIDPSRTMIGADGKRYLINTGERIYRATHRHHPCVKWARETCGNWTWLFEHALWLCDEYEHRFGRRHGALSVIEAVAMHWSSDRIERTPFVQAMPPQYQGPNAIEAYRRYYIGEKLSPAGKAARWTRRPPPEWITKSLDGAVVYIQR